MKLAVKKLGRRLPSALVGMETQVRGVISSLEIGIDDEVLMIGIKGMGGAGKAALARAVFDQVYTHFEAIIFVGNVREVSNGSPSCLKKLQEQVLSEVLNEHVTLNGVDDGIKMMRKKMCGKKVLLVLDDVSDIEQLQALAGEPDWFKPGSRILITTRDEQILLAHRVDVIHAIGLLSYQEAICLFSRYAFGRENPLQGYEELSGEVVRYAAGLPLTLKVLGSYLCGKDEDEWKDAIDRLKRIPLKETMEKLELSYISLEDEYKEIFLDVACLLKGQQKEDAIRILESCGFHARIGLKVLEQKSLITVDEGGFLGMHDHIEEMGKNIVRRSHPDEPNKHSRLWIDEEIEDILANDKGTEATRCLKLIKSRVNERVIKGLQKMKKLRYLKVTYADYEMGTTRDELLLVAHKVDMIRDSEDQIFVENVSEVSNASMFGLKKLQEQVLSSKRLRFSLGIMLMLIMVFICCFYSMGSRFDSSAPKLMVSTSNSSVENSWKYDVFLSFRGADTRKTFVGHLYEALKDKGIVTYKDDETIEQGERINDQLLKSIEESRFSIIVFSKNYASSSWCLDELVKIMECQKMTKLKAIPVFYDVDPTQVQNQDGPVGEAFSKHKNHEAAGKWRDAMEELAGLAGWDLANGDESKLIQNIVHDIFIKKYSTLSSADGKLVGMETRISKVISSLEIGTEDVRMIGIKGIGGGGKTTLARAVYDRISTMFEGKTFVENVREVSQPSLSGLKELQKQILEDVLHKKDITFSGVQDGKNMLKATMRSRKIIVILDDVDRIEELEALAGEHDWFKSGSRIIITTRDEQVLRAHRVDFVHDVNLLSFTEAICLFSRYAFQKEIPNQGFEELSGQVARYADGLPLTIKALGSSLCGKEKHEWQDAIDRLKKIPLKETMETLELSYISLEDEYKEIFLDIACILKGQHKQKAIRILESDGFHAIIGLKVLEQRSLVTISKCGVLGMHTHIEEMGKNIVRRGHPDEPHKHSRLWIKEEIEDILANDMGTEETRCLKLDMSRRNSRILMKGLGKMKKLRYLELNFAYYDTESDGECLGSDPKFDDASQLDESSHNFPDSLKYLKCSYYPFLYLPRTFQANNLVGLEMVRSRRMVQLWEEGEKKDLQKLKFLFLSDSEVMTFDFRITPNLEELYLENSDELEELCVPGCQKLKYLDVSDSKSITFDLGLTPNLETLSLFVCTHFVKLKVPVESPNLKYLNLRKSRLRSESLDLQCTDELVETNTPDGCLKPGPDLSMCRVSNGTGPDLSMCRVSNGTGPDLSMCRI